MLYLSKYLDFNSSGSEIAVAGRQDGIVDIYNTDSDSKKLSINNQTRATCVAISPLNNLIAIADLSGNIKVWSLNVI